ncbi:MULTISPECIES: AAA family ATPase [Bacillus cereus group]|uniref:AAA family ATPase n=1 Tax=Bacillus cereus group TaxID=86661 RepID=UPI0011EBDFA2|nr:MULTISPECIES: AAA family ATPase [Bacillus cereus group]MBE7105798.1 AAA family ATPase [Bacillus cereus]MBE7122134.1 AAA family ATPase [Bacillus cereus]QEL88342.1 AAA family ATPase [Bacillus mycoides]
MVKILTEFLRPKSMEEVLGQSHLKKKNHPIMKMLENKNLKSILLYGPPGTGKSSLAKILAKSSDLPFEEMNATVNSTGDIREVIEKHSSSFVLILDEIHYLNKRLQSILLSYMEEGKVICIGTTTENPYKTIADAIRSRMFLTKVYPPNRTEVKLLIQKIKKIFNNIEIEPEAEELIMGAYENDVRKFITTLDLLFNIEENIITLEDVQSVLGITQGDDPSKLMSAFIKSLRGSDENASLYYLCRMIRVGVPGSQIFRRLSIFAAEDVGLAKPDVMQSIASAQQLYNNLGDEEYDSILILANLVVYLSLIPKSRSIVEAVQTTFKEIESGYLPSVPEYLLNYYKGNKKAGEIDTPFLPESCKNRVFFTPWDVGQEASVRKFLEKRRNS